MNNILNYNLQLDMGIKGKRDVKSDGDFWPSFSSLSSRASKVLVYVAQC